MFEIKIIKYKSKFDLFKSADSNSCMIWQCCISNVYVYIQHRIYVVF